MSELRRILDDDSGKKPAAGGSLVRKAVSALSPFSIDAAMRRSKQRSKASLALAEVNEQQKQQAAQEHDNNPHFGPAADHKKPSKWSLRKFRISSVFAHPIVPLLAGINVLFNFEQKEALQNNQYIEQTVLHKLNDVQNPDGKGPFEAVMLEKRVDYNTGDATYATYLVINQESLEASIVDRHDGRGQINHTARKFNDMLEKIGVHSDALTNVEIEYADADARYNGELPHALLNEVAIRQHDPKTVVQTAFFQYKDGLNFDGHKTDKSIAQSQESGIYNWIVDQYAPSGRFYVTIGAYSNVRGMVAGEPFGKVDMGNGKTEVFKNSNKELMEQFRMMGITLVAEGDKAVLMFDHIKNNGKIGLDDPRRPK